MLVEIATKNLEDWNPADHTGQQIKANASSQCKIAFERQRHPAHVFIRETKSERCPALFSPRALQLTFEAHDTLL